MHFTKITLSIDIIDIKVYLEFLIHINLNILNYFVVKPYINAPSELSKEFRSKTHHRLDAENFEITEYLINYNHFYF